MDAQAIKQLRETSGIGNPQPVLTLSPVLHQRRANRSVTEYRPERGSGTAWTSSQDESRELRAYDRLHEEPTRARKRSSARPGKEVNGNVARPGLTQPSGRGRRIAPGQELPSVRTWFAGESRDGGGRAGKPHGSPAGGPAKTRGRGGKRAAGGAAGSRRPDGSPAAPYASPGNGPWNDRAPAGNARAHRPGTNPGRNNRTPDRNTRPPGGKRPGHGNQSGNR
jgi:23S rRNA pseudouridine2605 synthase